MTQTLLFPKFYGINYCIIPYSTSNMMKIKRFLYCAVSLVALLSTFTAHTQTLYALKTTRTIRFEAAKITGDYQPHLVMGSNQAMLFKQKIAKFLIKKKATIKNPSLSPSAKFDLLKRISGRETSEMVEVLEPYQWKEYLRIKNRIQPIPYPDEL